MSVGFRILPSRPLPPAEIIAAFASHCTSHLADSMSHLQAASGSICPRHRKPLPLCGPALTVRTAPGDNLIVQKAVDLARPGEIIVVDVGGFADQAVVGEIMSRWAAIRKVGGFVVDGAIRDLDYIAQADMPVYARWVTPRGPGRTGPGEINVPVNIGGMVVNPGDIIVGDADGVVSVPLADVDAVLKAANALREREASMLASLATGKLDRSGIDKALAANGCEGL